MKKQTNMVSSRVLANYRCQLLETFDTFCSAIERINRSLTVFLKFIKFTLQHSSPLWGLILFNLNKKSIAYAACNAFP